jgi:hypothetical protein
MMIWKLIISDQNMSVEHDFFKIKEFFSFKTKFSAPFMKVIWDFLDLRFFRPKAQERIEFWVVFSLVVENSNKLQWFEKF